LKRKKSKKILDCKKLFPKAKISRFNIGTGYNAEYYGTNYDILNLELFRVNYQNLNEFVQITHSIFSR